MTNALETHYQQYIALSRYARWRDDLGRRETWPETVQRYFDHVRKWMKKEGVILTGPQAEELGDCESAVLGLKNMPSMRALMTAGKALERNAICAFNCAFLPVDDVRAFDETLYILCNGTGVGFSVETKYVSRLPEVAETFHDSDTVIVVGDSKEGWATSFRELIALLYAGKIPKWDVSKVRPKGARLKTFGGRASGPGPLVELFEFCVKTFKAAAGRRLKDVECHDIMCKVGSIVVVGGVRRAALISLSDLDSYEMRNCKSGQWWEFNDHRALANNSAVYYNKPDIGKFLEEWLSLYRSGSGERGIFNLHAVRKMNNGRRDFSILTGVNPCCVPGECLVLTREGHRKIDSLVGMDVDIWNGAEWSTVKPFYTGKQELLDVCFSDGTSLRCTPNHKFILDVGLVKRNGVMGRRSARVEADDLEVGDKLFKFDMPVVTEGVDPTVDAYSQGFYSGDGNTGYKFSSLYAPKFMCQGRLAGHFTSEQEHKKIWVHGEMLPKSFVPIDASLAYRLNWLAGLLDSDGTVTRDCNGNGLQIVSVDHGFLRSLRLMLTTMGVKAKIVGASESGFRSMPDGNGGSAMYFCQETKRLLIGNTDTCNLVRLGLKCNRLEIHGNPPQRDARQFVRVVSVTPVDGFHDTYCFTEEKNGTGTFDGIVTGQSEVLLRSMQFCNLTTSVIRPGDTLDDIRMKVVRATILGTIQSAWTDFKYIRKAWKKNCEEERLLGVSMTGILDHPFLGQVESEERDTFLRELRDLAVAVNARWATILGIEPSAAISLIKPEGTTSALCDAAPGIHPRYSSFQIRTIRADIKDPVTQMMKDMGFPWEPCVSKPDSVVIFSFPQKAPEGARLRDDLTAVQQLKLWLAYKRNWAEHTISITVYVRPHEWIEVADFVYKNFDELTGVSFLPHSDHVYKQAPNQEITEAEYNELMAKMPKEVDWTRLQDYEKFDTTTSSQELACTGGMCEIQ